MLILLLNSQLIWRVRCGQHQIKIANNNRPLPLYAKIQHDTYMSIIRFVNTDAEHLKACFREAYQGFPELHNRQIIVRKLELKQTTMRAQPVVNHRFFSKKQRQYYIDFSDRMSANYQLKVENLPKEVLVGWFAHELGHVMDYLHRSGWNLMKFGIGYSFFSNFRIGAERKADLYAIAHGFADHIITTKKYILEKSKLPNDYKKRIEIYYMSPDEVALLAQDEEATKLRLDKVV